MDMSSTEWNPTSILQLIRKCLNLLNTRDRFYLALAASIQLSLIVLDLIGLILIGGIVAVITSSVQGTQLPSAFESIISVFQLDGTTPQTTTAILGIIAAFFMILKSFLGYYLGLRNFRFLASREVKISKGLSEAIFNQEIADLQRFSTPQYQYSLTTGSSSVMSGVIGQSLNITTEIALQLSMLFTLFFFSPLLTLICLLFFFSLFMVLNKYQGVNARKWGTGMSRANVATTSAIADAIGGYREILVSGRRPFFVQRIARSREDAATFQVNKQMLAQFSKYAFEICVVVSGLGISAYAFLSRPAIEAASLVAIFLTASTRIAPSVLKLQQGFLLLRGAAGGSELFFEIKDHVSSRRKSNETLLANTTHDYSLGISLRNVTYVYPQNNLPALQEISLDIAHLSTFAIVGPSGAGKSTLVDLILGVITPQSGDISVFGVSPIKLSVNVNRISYVPQNVYLMSGSILENIGFGLSPEDLDIEKCWTVLDRVHLKSWVSSLDNGIQTQVGERGSKLSGGQRQRIGIARALYQNPALLVLDEATSALDAESEYEISQTINSMKNQVTTIIIAHRLSTVKNCDSVVYLEGGKVMAQGTFDQLRDLIPNFDRQANLMGINR